MDALTLRDTLIEALQPLNVDVTPGEVQTGSDGRVRRTVILTITAGVAASRRAAGGTVDRDGYINALIVAPSRDSCLWLTEHVRDTLADYPLGHPHGRLTDESYDGDPLPEPDTTPARWSKALAFTATRKRNH